MCFYIGYIISNNELYNHTHKGIWHTNRQHHIQVLPPPQALTQSIEIEEWVISYSWAMGYGIIMHAFHMYVTMWACMMHGTCVIA